MSNMTKEVQELNLTTYRQEQQARGGLSICRDETFAKLAKLVKNKDTFTEFFAIANARGVADELIMARVLFNYRASGDWKNYAETTKKNFTNFKNFAKKYAGISSSTLANYLKIGALITDDYHSFVLHIDGTDMRYTQLLAIASVAETFDNDGNVVKQEPVFRVHVNGRDTFDENGIAITSTDDDMHNLDGKCTVEELNEHYAFVPFVKNLITRGLIRPKDTPDTIKQIVIAELSAMGLITLKDKAPEDKAPEDNAPEDNAPEDNASEDGANNDTETVTLSLPRHIWEKVSEFIADAEDFDLRAFQAKLDAALKG